MAQKVVVGMPQDLDLPDGWTFRITALDTTGAVVSGVKVSNLDIIADAPLGNVDTLAYGPFMLVLGPDA